MSTILDTAGGWLDGVAARRWRRLAESLPGMSPARRRRVLARAGALHGVLAEAMRAGAVAHPEHAPPGVRWAARAAPWVTPLPVPASVRPESGTDLGGGLRIFHDCPRAEVALHQPPRPEGGAGPVILDVFGFGGSFASLALALPDEGVAAMDAGHILDLTATLSVRPRAAVTLRLNLRQGPNVVRIPAAIAEASGAVSFDLGTAGLAPRRIEDVWIDILLERPSDDRLGIDDVVLALRPRAAL